MPRRWRNSVGWICQPVVSGAGGTRMSVALWMRSISVACAPWRILPNGQDYRSQRGRRFSEFWISTVLLNSGKRGGGSHGHIKLTIIARYEAQPCTDHCFLRTLHQPAAMLFPPRITATLQRNSSRLGTKFPCNKRACVRQNPRGPIDNHGETEMHGVLREREIVNDSLRQRQRGPLPPPAKRLVRRQ